MPKTKLRVSNELNCADCNGDWNMCSGLMYGNKQKCLGMFEQMCVE